MGGSSMCSEACGSASLNPIENRGLCCTGAADREVAEEPNEGCIPHPSSMWELMRWGWTSLLQHGALDEGRPRLAANVVVACPPSFIITAGQVEGALWGVWPAGVTGIATHDGRVRLRHACGARPQSTPRRREGSHNSLAIHTGSIRVAAALHRGLLRHD